MQLGQCSTSATLPLQNLFHIISRLIMYGIIWGDNSCKHGKTLTVKNKSSELWLMHDLELHV